MINAESACLRPLDDHDADIVRGLVEGQQVCLDGVEDFCSRLMFDVPLGSVIWSDGNIPRGGNETHKSCGLAGHRVDRRMVVDDGDFRVAPDSQRSGPRSVSGGRARALFGC